MKFKLITRKILTLILAVSMMSAMSLTVSATDIPAYVEPTFEEVKLTLSQEQENTLLKACSDAFKAFAGITLKDGLIKTINASEMKVTQEDGSVDKEVTIHLDLKDASSMVTYGAVFMGESFEEALKCAQISCNNLSAPTNVLLPYVTKLKATIKADYGVSVPEGLLFNMSGGYGSWLSIQLTATDGINWNNSENKVYAGSFNGVDTSTSAGVIKSAWVQNVMDPSKFKAMAEQAFKEQLGYSVPAHYQLIATYGSRPEKKVTLEWVDPTVDTSQQNYKTQTYIAHISLVDFNAGTGKIQALSEMTKDPAFDWAQPLSYTDQELTVMKKAAEAMAAKLGIQLGDYSSCGVREKGYSLFYYEPQKDLNHQFIVTKEGNYLAIVLPQKGLISYMVFKDLFVSA